VDAVFNSIDRAIKTNYKIESYQVRSVTSGRQAMGEVLVRIRYHNQINIGRGVSTDIIEASAKAYLQAINLLESEKIKSQNKNKQEKETLINVV
jgi:2-isopropylmalate synthase